MESGGDPTGPCSARKTGRSRWRVRLLGLLFVIFLLEGALQLLTLASTAIREAIVPEAIGWTVEDPAHGEMPNPRYADHDAWGFRNARVLESSDVVALGDSQTYGTGVARTSAWPSRLAVLSGHDVYSIAFGGWGQVKQASLVEKALSLRPRLVLVGVYTGNDFADCYRRVYLTETFPTYRTADAQQAARIAAAEAASPLYGAVNDLTRAAGVASEVRSLAKTLSRQVRLLGIARKMYDLARGAGRTELSGRVSDAAWKSLVGSAAGDATQWAFEGAAARTIFTPHLRHCALDADDPRMVDGARISVDAVARMAEQCRQRGARLVVVFIPTKEFAMRELVALSRQEPPVIFRALVEKEQRLRASYLEACRDRAIPVIDVAPDLSAAVLAGSFPYPANVDGHPTPAGHDAIAQAVLAAIAREGLLE